MRTFAYLVLKARISIIIAAIAITAILGFFLKDIRINPDITSYLPESDPVVSLFDYIGKEYAGNLMAMVVVQCDDIFTIDNIASINDLTNEFELIEGVSQVTSITNVLDIRKGDEGIEIGKLIDRYALPRTDEELSGLKKYVLSRDIYRGRLVSSDGSATLIVCRLADDVDEVAAAEKIKAITQGKEMKADVSFGGSPFMMLDITHIVTRDLMFLIPIAAFVCAVLLFLSFRSLHGVLLPLLSVAMSSIWTAGIMSLLRVPLTIVSDIIPVILVAVGSAYSIHVINAIRERRLSGRGSLQDCEHALRDVAQPVMLAALTTIFGFLSFVLGSYLEMIREFGIFTSVGILFSLLISLTVVPAIISLLPLKAKDGASKGKTSSMPARLCTPLVRKRRYIVIAGIVIFLVFLAGMPKLQRKVDIVDYFKPNTFTRRAEKVLRTEFGGSTPIYILTSGNIQEPSVLQEMRRLQDFLESQGDINNIQSVVNLLETMSDVIGEGKTVPNTKGKVANLWFLLEGEEIMRQLVNPGKDEAVIQATMQSGLDSERIQQFVDQLNRYIEKTDTTVCHFSQTGMPSIYHNLDTSIIKSQLFSIAIAIVLVYLVLCFLLRSAHFALKAMVPIVFSLGIIFGFMGFVKMPLDIATVLVGSISIGIGIDYSIHFVSRYRRELCRNSEVSHSLCTTLGTTGKAILINVVTVGIGLGVLAFAQIVPLQRFGILIALTMVSSGFASLVLLPAVLALGEQKRNKKEV
jgi:predicted RND superfamily exporter protein